MPNIGHACAQRFSDSIGLHLRQLCVSSAALSGKKGLVFRSSKLNQKPRISGYQGSKRSSPEASNTDYHKDSVIKGPKEFFVDVSGENPAFALQSKLKSDLIDSSINARTFSDLSGLRKDILNGVDSLSISQPTVIQLKSIPLILQGKNVLCAAQTGSGKTLAYLIPVLNMLKDGEEKGLMTKFQHPKACIIAPFRELAAQILQVVKALSHHVPLRSVGCIGGEKDKIMYRALREKPVDIVVGTPGTVLDLLTRNKIFFSNLKYLVFDEVDTMYDASFKGMTNELLKSIQPKIEAISKEDSCKVVFATATLPRLGVLNHIKEQIKQIVVVTANLHHVLPNVRYHFIKALQPEKPEELLRLLDLKIAGNKKVLIFVNTNSASKWLSKYLCKKEIEHFMLSGKTSPEERQKIVKDYRSRDGGIIISTDLASRGLDFPDLYHVINYDCPLNTTDFIHRAGRTGRARADYVGTPVVYTFLSRNWEVTLARKVQFAAEKRKAISDVKVIDRGPNVLQIVRD